jgi:hypothetical protein
MRARALLAFALLSQCKPPRAPPQGPPRPDAGTRIAVTEAAPLGPSADRREVDVPLDWIYLLTDPAPTGRTPYAVVGARVPCGYEALYLTSEKDGSRVKIRFRARWSAATPVPVTPPTCERVAKAWLVSEGILRLGDWEVVDMVPHGASDPPAPTTRVQHVVPEDANLAPLAARWVRGCAADPVSMGPRRRRFVTRATARRARGGPASRRAKTTPAPAASPAHRKATASPRTDREDPKATSSVVIHGHAGTRPTASIVVSYDRRHA